MGSVSKLSLFLLTITLFNCSEKEKFLEINGKTVNTDTKSILLVKPNQDFRFDSLIEIPVENGIFHYKTQLKYPEAVNLILESQKEKKLVRYMPLFLENERIDLTIHAEDDFDKNIVKGGNLNAEYQKYKQRIDAEFDDRINPLTDSISELYKNDEYYSDADKHLSLKARMLEDKLKSVYKEREKFRQEYIENNPTIVSYSFFLHDLNSNKEKIDVQLARKNYQKLSGANPDHPYNELALNLLNAIENIKVGKKYADFSAPDLQGNIVKLSDEIRGKVALLDLWATWCGPCVAHSRALVPIYNEYKNKGFTVVGVAGEFKNTDRLERFFEKETWPWLNLVELDKKNGIWRKYGVRGGGGIFLFDENGVIIAIDPTAEEVRKELEARLK